MIYRPSPQAETAEIQYATLYNSVMHHLMEALEKGAADYASMLICVLYGAFVAQFPEGHNARTRQGYTAFIGQVQAEMRQPDAPDILHDIAHIPPGWIKFRPPTAARHETAGPHPCRWGPASHAPGVPTFRVPPTVRLPDSAPCNPAEADTMAW
jgi:hypothetical protein